MKKNFFKKLSFVLALAMIVSVIAPAAGVFAAAKPALNSTKQYLYLSELSGKTEYDFNVKNKVAGSKYAWTSSNEAAATVDKANGFTTAVGVGSTKVSVKITDKKKKVTTLTATVIVRDNIQTVTVANAPEKALVVGASFDFNRSFVTASGSTTKTTSITRWTVDKTTATITDAGVFTATEAGTYKVQALAFQSKAKYDAWKISKDASLVLDSSDEVTVTVAATMTVAQTDVDSIKLTFDSAMTDVAKNLSLYVLVGTTEVAVTTAKPVSVSTDMKSATVDFYVALTEGATYVVKYTGVETVKFTAATAAVDKVTKVVVKTTEAVVNVAKAIEVQLFDANGVDITTDALKTRITLSSSSNRTFLNQSTKELVIFTKGDTTQIEATFHTYKYESGKEIGNVVGTGTVVGVDVASTVYGTVKAWTMVGSGPVFTDVKQIITVGETKNLYVQLNTTVGTEAKTIDNSAGMGKFSFVSSDSSVLFFNGGALIPVKAGTVSVVVNYDGKAVDVLTISVGAARAATSIVLGKTEVALSNGTDPSLNDTAKVSVKVKDQYSEDFAIGTITFDKLAGSPASLIASVVGTDVVFAGAGAEKGTYYYKVTAKNLSAYVTVIVADPDEAATVTYMLSLGATEVDSKSTTNGATPTLSIDLFGYAGGTKITKPAITGAGFNVVITNPDGDKATLTSTTFGLTTQVASGAGFVVTPIKSGTYTVTATYNTGTASGTAVDVKYFTVNNTQAKPTFELKNTTFTGTDLNAIAQNCFKVSFDGSEKTDFVMGETLGSVATELFVKNLKWTQKITVSGVDYYVVHTIDVNRNVKVK